MKVKPPQIDAPPETREERKSRADVAHIVEEDELKQIDRDRSAEDALDEALDDRAAEEEEVDELDQEDEVVRIAQRNL